MPAGAQRVLTLASRSPQRRAILEQLGVAFTVEEPDAQERTAGDAEALVAHNARAKAQSVRAGLVLGVDTAVELDDRVFGKPADEGQARGFLRLLAGRTHRVWSGIALIEDGRERSAVSMTHVRFRRLGPEEIDWYIATGEWRERAGAYAIQERGAALVERVEGDYTGVVGLPVAELVRLAPALLR
ncbi:Maf family protein [soil metagenome]